MNTATIDNFENMTYQQIFDLCAAHVIKNGRQSVRENNRTCMYAGIGCAASPLLKPEYREAFDEFEADWDTLIDNGHVAPYAKALIIEIQNSHDYMPPGEEFMPFFLRSMRNVAKRFNLSPAVLDTYEPES